RRPHVREVPADAEEEPRRAHAAARLQAREVLRLREGRPRVPQGDARPRVVPELAAFGELSRDAVRAVDDVAGPEAHARTMAVELRVDPRLQTRRVWTAPHSTSKSGTRSSSRTS